MTYPFYFPDWVYEAITLILLVLGAGGAGFLIFWKSPRLRHFRQTRRLRFVVLTVALVGLFALVFYSSFIAPRHLAVVVKNVDLARADFRDPVRIVVISDLHFGPYNQTAYAKKVVQTILAEHPDVVLIAGDSVAEEVDQLAYGSPLQTLADQIPTFAVLGNHDSGRGAFKTTFVFEPARRQGVLDWLTKYHIRVLINEAQYISIRGHNFWLAGVDEYVTGRDDEALAKRQVTTNDPVILLAHNPDVIYRAEREKFDLVIAGHTHGGQVRLPFYGPVGHIPTELGRYFDKGLFTFGETKLFITSGLGESGARARLFNPPEVVILRVF